MTSAQFGANDGDELARRAPGRCRHRSGKHARVAERHMAGTGWCKPARVSRGLSGTGARLNCRRAGSTASARRKYHGLAESGAGETEDQMQLLDCLSWSRLSPLLIFASSPWRQCLARAASLAEMLFRARTLQAFHARSFPRRLPPYSRHGNACGHNRSADGAARQFGDDFRRTQNRPADFLFWKRQLHISNRQYRFRADPGRG